MPNDHDTRFAHYDRILEQLVRGQDQMQGFIAQQMVMNARLERRHEEHEARFALQEATMSHQEARLSQGEAMLEELRGFTRAQEAHNQALYVMHEELRQAFVNLELRLARIEGLLEQNLRGGENGREA